MPAYEISPEALERVLIEDHGRRVRRVIGAIQRAVAVEGPRIAQEEVDATQPLPVDRGDYRRRFEAYDTPRGAVFLNTSAHGPIVEGGRRPGRFPPRDIIEAWVRRKFRLRLSEMFPSRKAGARGPRFRGTRAGALRGIAFLVARKIARRGIPGKHVMARVEARLTPIVRDAAMMAAGGDHAP